MKAGRDQGIPAQPAVTDGTKRDQAEPSGTEPGQTGTELGLEQPTKQRNDPILDHTVVDQAEGTHCT